ncbi:MAG: hypothetical protein GY850_09735 [bacterium]|nr:hypothetical protein [bacterium]
MKIKECFEILELRLDATMENEVCRINGAAGAYHMDVFMAYRAWCSKKGLKPLSIGDLDKALDAFDQVAIRTNNNGIDSVFWRGLEISEAWLSDDIFDPTSYDPHEQGMPREFPEPKEYSEMDNDDDLSEVIF